MDILSHGLWGGLIAKAANRTQPRASYGWAFWWGVFPDLAAFGIPFLWLLSMVAFTPLGFSDIVGMRNEEPPMFPGSFWFTTFAPFVYRFSHSLLVFIAVFALAFIIQRRTPWVLLGWPLHILMDIPSHTTRFYPTPFLWPVSDLRIDGIPWSTPWIMVANYGLLLVLYFALRSRRSKTVPFQNSKS